MRLLLPSLLLASLLLTACQSAPAEIPVTTAPAITEPAQEPSEASIETTIPEPTEETTMATLPPAPEDSASLVAIRDYIPNIAIELKYAGSDNFTGQQIYDFQEAYLRYATVEKLQLVQESLREIGLSLKIWDAYRPVSAQFQLWAVCPDPAFVANPNVGYSNHNRGNAVDVTLVDADGQELEMPTGFDDFSTKANRDYSDCNDIQRENAELLETIMKKYGFKPYYGEWWHFADTQTYPVEQQFQPER